MLQNPNEFPNALKSSGINAVWSAQTRCKAFRRIRAGSTQKGCGRAADVFAEFHGNLRGKTEENFGTT